jgi:hypothetical protein
VGFRRRERFAGPTDHGLASNRIQWHGYCGRTGGVMRKVTCLLLWLVLGIVTLEAFGNNTSEVIRPVRQILGRLHLTAEEFDSLADRRIVVHPLSSRSTREMAAVGVVLADARPSGFIEAYKTLAVFENNSFVLESGVFGSAPRLSDLDRLTIDPIDLYGLSHARAGDSDIKLSGGELRRIQTLAASWTRLSPQAMVQIGAEYKRILLDRATRYMGLGDAGMGDYVDKAEPVSADQAFQSLADEQFAESGLCSHIREYFRSPPARLPSDSESLLYWAKQRFHDLKSVISLVHLLIHREGERVFIASKQIYSSHYNEAGLSVAELIPFADDRGITHTVVVYTIRLEPDMLGGSLGFVKKRMAMPKMQMTLKYSLGRIRDNLEARGAVAASALGREKK